jgi:hypothetical protein
MRMLLGLLHGLSWHELLTLPRDVLISTAEAARLNALISAYVRICGEKLEELGDRATSRSLCDIRVSTYQTANSL